jgi:phage terminase small subunit
MGHHRLTMRQEMFCKVYWRTRCASAAYRAAFDAAACAPATIHRRASELLKNPKVTAMLDEFERQAREAFGDVARQVVSELSDVAFSDIGDFVDAQGDWLPVEHLPAAARRAIADVKVRRSAGSSAVLTVRLLDKVKALGLLLQLTGAADSQAWGDRSIEQMTDNEIEAELRHLDVVAEQSQARQAG